MYESQGLQQSLACVENGNYNALQKFTNGLFYCVDEDGFAKSEMYDSAPDCSQFK